MENLNNPPVTLSEDESPATGWGKLMEDISEEEWDSTPKEKKQQLRDIYGRVQEQEESEHSYVKSIKLSIKEEISRVKDDWGNAQSLSEKLMFITEAAFMTAMSPFAIALMPFCLGADAIRFAINKKRYGQDKAELDNFFHRRNPEQPNEATPAQEQAINS